jgi:hypothetical protein
MSQQITARDRVPAGSSLHAKCGFLLADSVKWVVGSMTQKANSPGIMPPSLKESLQSFIALSSGY